MFHRQFIPQQFCLHCDICCRFSQVRSVWTPLFTESEIRYLVKKKILPPSIFTATLTHQIAHNKKAQYINLIAYKDLFICPCFNPSGQKCRIYQDRPFECRLYPFLLIKKCKKLFLGLDKRCPYLGNCGKEKIESYIDYLKREFQKQKNKSFLAENKDLFAEYPHNNLELLFSLDL